MSRVLHPEREGKAYLGHQTLRHGGHLVVSQDEDDVRPGVPGLD